MTKDDKQIPELNDLSEEDRTKYLRDLRTYGTACLRRQDDGTCNYVPLTETGVLYSPFRDDGLQPPPGYPDVTR